MKEFWRPQAVGDVIAERACLLRLGKGRPREVLVRFGRPVRAPHPKRNDPWQCPVEILGFGNTHFQSVCGEDSLQALVLALRYAERFLPVLAREAGGHIEWLGEQERAIFGFDRMNDLAWQANASMLSVLYDAVAVIEHSSPASQRERARVLRRAKELLEHSGHPGRKWMEELPGRSVAASRRDSGRSRQR